MYDEYMDNLFERRPQQGQPMPQPGQMPMPMPQPGQPMPKVGEIYLYTVSRGDNVYAIARRYNANMQHIKDINQLNEEALIYPGQTLLIPVLFSKTPPMKPQQRQSYELYF